VIDGGQARWSPEVDRFSPLSTPLEKRIWGGIQGSYFLPLDTHHNHPYGVGMEVWKEKVGPRVALLYGGRADYLIVPQGVNVGARVGWLSTGNFRGGLVLDGGATLSLVGPDGSRTPWIHGVLSALGRVRWEFSRFYVMTELGVRGGMVPHVDIALPFIEPGVRVGLGFRIE